VTQIFAHRGLHTIEPENSVRSFLEAKAAGADGVELDVRPTADGALVIHHDAEVEGHGALSQVACRDLPPEICTLAEAMSACEGMQVNVEIKNHPSESVYDATGSLASRVVSALGDLGWLDRVIISCFDLPTCEAVRRADAEVEIGWLLNWREDPRPTVAVAAERGLSAVHPFFARVDEELVRRAHDRGLAVNVWTVNEAEQIARMFSLDVDSVITDDPVLARAVLNGL
jgi:glycerophosphoryl diester phosphodiesterase